MDYVSPSCQGCRRLRSDVEETNKKVEVLSAEKRSLLAEKSSLKLQVALLEAEIDRLKFPGGLQIAKVLLDGGLPAEIDCIIYRFLPITEVCMLKGVTTSSRRHVGGLLTSTPWEAIYEDKDESPPERAYKWFKVLTNGNVRLRTVRSVGSIDEKKYLHCAITESVERNDGDVLQFVEPHVESLLYIARYLNDAVWKEHLSVLDALWKMNIVGVQEILTSAAQRERFTVVRHLWRQHVNDAEVGTNLLHYAMKWNRADVVELLLREGNFDVTVELLKLAMSSQDTPGDIHQLLQMMLKLSDIDINAVEEGGGTLLHWALSAKCVDHLAIKSLLRVEGIDVNVRDTNGRTPLYVAVESHPVTPVLMSLQEADGADPNASDNNGRTPFHALFERPRNIYTVRNFLKAGHLDPNARDKIGRTPLHVAVTTRNNEDALKFLLDVPNVDVSACDNNGMTPLHLITDSAGTDRELLQRVKDFDRDEMIKIIKYHYRRFWI